MKSPDGSSEDGSGEGLIAPRLRILSYNIQSGLTTNRYTHYVTRGWKHLVPVPSRMHNLVGIANLVSRYDLVGLQEVDAGSLRSGFLDQAHYLADRARFEHYYAQTNRRVGRITRHCNVMLSRIRPAEISDHKLPGRFKGRGALVARFGGNTPDSSLYVFVVHLALSRRARKGQLQYLARKIDGLPYVIVMGDTNCASNTAEMQEFREEAGLVEPIAGLRTFPSWRPAQQLDHMLVSPALPVHAVEVLSYRYSDHLPIAMEIDVPLEVRVNVLDRRRPPENAQHWHNGA